MPLPINQKPKGPKNWGKFSKTLSFWVLITLLAGTLFTYTSRARDTAPTISYTQYRQQLEANNIATAKIQGGTAIIGDFRNPIPINRRAVNRFTVRLPVANSEEEVKQLNAKNVQIVAEDRSPPIATLFLTFL